MIAAAIERDMMRECYEHYNNNVIWAIARYVSHGEYQQQSYSKLVQEMKGTKRVHDERTEE